MCTTTTATTRHWMCTTSGHSTSIDHRRDFNFTWISTPKHHRRNDSMSKFSSSKFTEWRHLSVCKFHEPVAFESSRHSSFLFHAFVPLFMHRLSASFLTDIADVEIHAHKSPTAPLVRWRWRQPAHSLIQAHKPVSSPFYFRTLECTAAILFCVYVMMSFGSKLVRKCLLSKAFRWRCPLSCGRLTRKIDFFHLLIKMRKYSVVQCHRI